MFRYARTSFVLSGIALVLLCVCGAAQQAFFTLEQIISSPFPDGLTTAPSGGAVA